MNTENNQAPTDTGTPGADSASTSPLDKLSVLGSSMGFGNAKQPKTAGTQQAAPVIIDNDAHQPEQPTDRDSGGDLDDPTISSHADEAQPVETDEEAAEAQTANETDPLGLLFDEETLYDVGEDTPITGAELKARQMRQSDYTQKTQALATSRAEIETERGEYANNLAFFDQANQAALNEYQNVDWRSLQMQNPAQYQELAQGFQQLQMRQQQIDSAKTQFLTGVQQQQATLLQGRQNQAIEHMRAAVPDISDRMNDITARAKDYGFDDNEIAQMSADPRVLKMLLDSQALKTARATTTKALKQDVQPQPTPRATPSATAQAQTKNARLTQEANRGNQDAARQLLKNRLSNKAFRQFNR